MAKYYVTASQIKLVVQAEDAEGAALWALHQTLSTKMVGEVGDITSQQVNDFFANWGESISVSERGFSHHDAGCFRTAQAVKNYVQLIVALERIADENSTAK